MTSYYLDSFDSPYYPSASSQQDLLLSNELHSFPSSRTGTPRASNIADTRPLTFPIYDSDSPFNSPIVPVKSVGMDGRLKTKLMGTGLDGGFLTSPLTFGKSRMVPPNGSSLSFDSPAPSLNGSLNGSQNSILGASSSAQESYSGQRRSLSGGGSEMGASVGVLNDVQGSFDMADYSTRSFYAGTNGNGFGKKNRAVSEASAPQFVEYPAPPPQGRDMGPAPIQFIEHRFPQSPPPPAKSMMAAAPTSMRRTRKVSESVSTSKTLNKVRSCPSLVPGPPPQIEPLTPVSSHINDFLPLPGVPFNSPTDDSAVINPTTMPFSFADLYSYGLAADSVDDIDPRKSPYAFVNELLNTESGAAMKFGADPSQEFGLMYGLPTPHLAPSSFSSPSTTFNSEPSPPESNLISPVLLLAPELGEYSLPPAQTTSRQRCLPYNSQALPTHPPDEPSTAALDPSLFSAAVTGHRHVSTPSFIPNPTYSYPTAYAPDPGHVHHLGPYAPASWSTNQSQVNDFGQTIQPVDQAYSDSAATCVPSVVSPQQIHQHYMTQRPRDVSNSDRRNLPPRSSSFAAQSGLFTASGGLFEPVSLPQGPPPVPFDSRVTRNANSRAGLEAYGQTESTVSTAPSTPHKRARETTDDEDYRDDATDGDGEYVPGSRGFSPAPVPITSSGTRNKRQRVASAPPVVGRRLRPGPKPKSTSRSPQETCQSVFSLSPPPLPYHRAVSSPYMSDYSSHSPNPETDDGMFQAKQEAAYEGLGIGGSTLDRPPESSLPKSVIQSLYNAIPAHVKNGTKNPKRYACLIEGCDRIFPRKSAIESHIQTHLEDKPFVCNAPDW